MTERMKIRAETIAVRLAESEERQHANILFLIVEAAAAYWDADGIDPTDFCVQHVGFEVVVFGGTNRLKWSPRHGFVADRGFCSPNFLARYDALGPLPKTS